MTTEEALNIADKAISELTGKFLTDLQSELLKASWKNQTYEDFAETHGYCLDYVKKDVGSQLWRLLSEGLGEKVTKKNFRQALERHKELHKFVNFQEKEKRYDLGNSPDTSVFYGNEKELGTLKNWVLEDRCRLIAIVGVGGIGKTALAGQLMEQVKDEFEYVIWRSLRHTIVQKNIVGELVYFLSDKHDGNTKTESLLQYLRSSRCLVILDRLESILEPGKLTGEYSQGYEEYGELLKLIGETNHQSCFILTSREKPFEISDLEGQKSSVRSLRLKGSLEIAQALIKQEGLSGSEEEKQELCWNYGCNPKALKISSTSINDLFDGKISDFLEQDTIVLNGIRRLLDSQFARLSSLEQIIMYWLAINRSWISIPDLVKDITPVVHQTKILKAIESLHRRSLVEKRSSKYTQQLMVMDYTKERLIEGITDESIDQKISLFNDDTLLKKAFKDHVAKIL
ncbi:MAG: NB-ARC domain-containing protein [Cyanobacteria bacterium J06639_18]